MPHKFQMPKPYVDRLVQRQGREHTVEHFEDTKKTALVVIDMQNYFMHDTQQSCVPMAREVVDNVNKLAAATRAAGGKVIWVQNFAPYPSKDNWDKLKERYTAEGSKLRWESMQKEAFGFELWPTLDVKPEDLRVTKRRFSAFIQGSSDIEIQLKDCNIDTIMVSGVATNVCCESTARDAMMLNYRTLMVSDACAATTDEEHAASLSNFYLFFGDVQTTDELVARLDVAKRRNVKAAE
jgi:ureidoacrylate peracid hydrolase